MKKGIAIVMAILALGSIGYLVKTMTSKEVRKDDEAKKAMEEAEKKMQGLKGKEKVKEDKKAPKPKGKSK